MSKGGSNSAATKLRRLLVASTDKNSESFSYLVDEPI